MGEEAQKSFQTTQVVDLMIIYFEIAAISRENF